MNLNHNPVGLDIARLVRIAKFETRPIISNHFFPPIVVTLASLWGIKLYRQGVKESRSAWSYVASLAPFVILGRNDCWVAACAYSGFYLTWISLPMPSSSTEKPNLPGFDSFVKRLPDSTATQASEEDSSTGRDGSDCLVCWSAEWPPKELPCKHLICYDCLKSMRDHDQHTCPYCSRPLFTRKEILRATFYKADASLLHLEITLSFILLALRIHRGGFQGPQAWLSLGPLMMDGSLALVLWATVHVDGADWWRGFAPRTQKAKILLVAATLVQLHNVTAYSREISRLDVEAVVPWTSVTSG